MNWHAPIFTSKKRKGTRSGIELYNQIAHPTNFVLSLIVIIFALSCLLPVLLVLGISLSTEEAIAAHGYSFIPQEFSLEAYSFIFRGGSTVLNATRISVIITVIGTVLGLLITSMMGYALSRPRYKLRNPLSFFIMIPMLFSGGMIPSYMVVSQFLGLKNTLWALILPMAVSAFNIIIFRTNFQTNVPGEIIESAEIDGANQIKIFASIVVPISKPVFATIAILSSFGYWNDWYNARLYIDENRLRPLQSILMVIQNQVDFLNREAQELGAAALQEIARVPTETVRMAIVIIVVVPIAMVYPFFQQYFVSGLTVGAVKG